MELKKIDVEKHLKDLPLIALVHTQSGPVVISQEKMLLVEVVQEPQSIQYWFTDPEDLQENEFAFFKDMRQHIIKAVQEEMKHDI